MESPQLRKSRNRIRTRTSSNNSRELLSRAFQAGARGYVLKADVDGELLKALRIVTGDGSYISPKIDESSATGAVREITSGPRPKEKP